MPSDKLQLKVHVTHTQKQAEAEAIHKSGLTPSDFRRLAIQTLVEQYGITWPDDMPQHGGKREQDSA